MKSALITSALGCAILSFPQSGVHADTMKNPKKMSMTGCVAEKDGKYMMMNKEHPDGVELMASQDMMKPHVGHMMKVTGTMGTGGAMSKMDPPSGSAMSSGDSTKQGSMGMKHDNMGIMKVSSMKMMSDHCDASPMAK
jgi:hypothetical protein